MGGDEKVEAHIAYDVAVEKLYADTMNKGFDEPVNDCQAERPNHLDNDVNNLCGQAQMRQDLDHGGYHGMGTNPLYQGSLDGRPLTQQLDSRGLPVPPSRPDYLQAKCDQLAKTVIRQSDDLHKASQLLAAAEKKLTCMMGYRLAADFMWDIVHNVSYATNSKAMQERCAQALEMYRAATARQDRFATEHHRPAAGLAFMEAWAPDRPDSGAAPDPRASRGELAGAAQAGMEDRAAQHLPTLADLTNGIAAAFADIPQLDGPPLASVAWEGGDGKSHECVHQTFRIIRSEPLWLLDAAIELAEGIKKNGWSILWRKRPKIEQASLADCPNGHAMWKLSMRLWAGPRSDLPPIAVLAYYAQTPEASAKRQFDEENQKRAHQVAWDKRSQEIDRFYADEAKNIPGVARAVAEMSQSKDILTYHPLK